MKSAQLIIFLAFTLFATTLRAQNAEMEIGKGQLDSLIASKVSVEKLNEIIKNGSTVEKTRGLDPCDADFDNIAVLFKNLKSAYVACCNGTSNITATVRIIRSIYNIINNSKCKWDDHPLMWAAILVYWADYNALTSKYNCCR